MPMACSAQFLENFSGDNVRYLARSFGNPGDHDGQESRGYRFPYGPTGAWCAVLQLLHSVQSSTRGPSS